MRYYFCLLLGTIAVSCQLFASRSVDSLVVKRQLSASRTHEAIHVDGSLAEPICAKAMPASDFIQYDQYNGQKPSQQTSVKVLYDDDALYVGARLYDSCPECIYRELGKRDNSDNLKSDVFSMVISTYNDGLNFLQFTVSASGVQTDVKLTADEEERAWNAVWISGVKIDSLGWCVEMRIPYSALRFANNGGNSQWGINFYRLIKRYNETSTWSFVNKSKQGVTTQAGVLTGVDGVKPPVRLSFSPYLSGYANKQPGHSSFDFDFNGGMDFKLGLNESFTLDMTLIPDFGQVQSDEKVLNLTPYEVKYDEARQFFTEGTELFNKGGIFYSRRIGSTPVDHNKVENALTLNEVITENPVEAKMINATKLSGRTADGLGIGFFNAMTQKSYAHIRDTVTGTERRFLTQGFTNYNMVVLDQTLPHSSYISLANTNLTRPNGNYVANVTATQFMIRDRKKRFGVEGVGAISRIFDDSTTTGYKSNLVVGKTSGNFKGDVWGNIESKHYNPNDMGYLQSPNELSVGAEVSYETFKPLWRFVQFETEMEFVHTMLYSPRSFSAQYITSNTRFTTIRQFSGSIYLEQNLRNSFDYFEPRVEGYKLMVPQRFYAKWYGSPDYRRVLAIDHSIDYWKTDRYNQHGYSYTIAPRIRFNDKALLILSWSHSLNYNNIGHFGFIDGDVVMGKRDIETFTNTVNLQYTFNSKSFVNLKLRHYVRHFTYDSFYTLSPDGMLAATANPPYSSVNYNLFNIDLLYQWNFAPGSELVVVWKNSIEDSGDRLVHCYSDNVRDVLDSPQYNSVSLKVLFYIDYQMLRRLKR